MGVFGNIVSLIVIRRTEDWSTTSKFLTSLAVADTMTLMTRGAQMVFTLGEMFWPNIYLKWKLKIFSFHALSLLPYRISKGITVAIVCDRVVALTAPLHYKIICRPMRITVTIVMVYVVIASTTIPNIVNIFVYHLTSEQNGKIYTGKQFIASEVSQSRVKLLLNMLNLVIFDCMPIPVVFVCNVVILIALRSSNVLASTTNEVQQQRKHQERQLTKLLLTISILFLVLNGIPSIYMFLSLAGIRVSPTDADIASMVDDIRVTLSLINCAINFIVYTVMNKKYREGYVAILCRCRRSNDIQDLQRN